LLKDDSLSTFQKTIQFFLLWCLPIIGLFLVWFFLKDSFSHKNTKNHGTSKSSDATSYAWFASSSSNLGGGSSGDSGGGGD